MHSLFGRPGHAEDGAFDGALESGRERGFEFRGNIFAVGEAQMAIELFAEAALAEPVRIEVSCD